MEAASFEVVTRSTGDVFHAQIPAELLYVVHHKRHQRRVSEHPVSVLLALGTVVGKMLLPVVQLKLRPLLFAHAKAGTVR